MTHQDSLGAEQPNSKLSPIEASYRKLVNEVVNLLLAVSGVTSTDSDLAIEAKVYTALKLFTKDVRNLVRFNVPEIKKVTKMIEEDYAARSSEIPEETKNDSDILPG